MGETAGTWSGMRSGAVVGMLLVVLLIVGADRASAAHSVLCKENVSICAKASQYPEATYVTGTLESASAYAEVELPGFMTISCTVGKLSGSTTSHEIGPLTGKTGLIYGSSCKPEGCSINAGIGAEFPWELEAKGGGDGTIRISNPVIPVACTKFPYNFSCKYGAVAINGEFEGGPAGGAYLSIGPTSMSLISGVGCASKANLRFRDIVREPSQAIYVTN